MKVKVNRRTLELFEGARVKNALLRYFTVKKLDRQLIDSVEVKDAYGHEVDHDAPLTDGQKITFDDRLYAGHQPLVEPQKPV